MTRIQQLTIPQFEKMFPGEDSCSAKYLPLYVAEFEFRYNNRNTGNIFGAAVGAC